jgi:hypothetical protein
MALLRKPDSYMTQPATCTAPRTWAAPTIWGTLFKVDPSGNETVLHNFDGSTGDGGDVVSSLIEDSAGNFYGAT